MTTAPHTVSGCGVMQSRVRHRQKGQLSAPIPQRALRLLGVAEGDILDVKVEGEQITITKHAAHTGNEVTHT